MRNVGANSFARTRFGRALRRRFLLDPSARFLNHGSYGATPRAVLAAQAKLRERLERQPVAFMQDFLPDALRRTAADLGDFIGARGEDLAFVENATAGINAVFQSFPWRRGDELLLSSHVYPAVKNAAHHVAAAHRVRVREVRIPFPLDHPREITEAYAEAAGSRTRLAVVDHVASPSALVFPVREIVARLKARGIRVLVDGAHAPGMLDLSVNRIGADWYAGNCHKWLFVPKGCSFLWAGREAQANLHPPVISNRYGEGFPAEFDWCGTRDPSAWLSLDAALDFYRSLGGKALRAHNRDLAWRAARSLAAAWNVALPAPRNCFAAMVTLSLPGGAGGDAEAGQRLRAALWERHRIEVPVFSIEGRLYLRLSAQVYNEIDDYRGLAAALPRLLT